MRAWAVVAIAFLTACSKPAPISEREAATELLARYLAAELRPKAVLVLSNPFSQESGRPAEVYEFERAGMAGLKRGFNPETPVKIAYPEVSAQARENPQSVQIDPKSTTPLSFLVSENAFQLAVAKHPECDLVISLIGLPLKLKAFPAWAESSGPKFGLLFPDWRMIGNREAIARAFESGKLAAAVVRQPGAVPPFALMTATNAAALFNAQPQLFAP